VADSAPAASAGAEPAILHVDMDAFFAAVEVLHDPTLRGKPVIVGGSGRRGVVASCTYEARVYGVHSAMPSVRARQLCPDAVFVDGHYSQYAEVSGRLREILLSATPLVEPIGLDEAFLDVTGSRRLLGPPAVIAHGLRSRVADELSLDCSIGIGRSKLVAKLASRAAKPRVVGGQLRPGRGVYEVRPEDELAFLHPMPVEALWGVGPATAERLRAIGVRTVGELAALPPAAVVRRLGKAHGGHLVALANGEDPSPVVADRPAKSIGHEETFGADVCDTAALARHALRMSESVAEQLRLSRVVARTVTVKVKFGDFSLITRSHTLGTGIDTAAAINAVAGALLEPIDAGPGVRLLGVSMSGLEQLAPESARQMAFDLDTAGPEGEEAARLQAGWREVISAVDAIRERYGRTAVGSVGMLRDDGLHIPARREAPWGPSAEESGATPASGEAATGDDATATRGAIGPDRLTLDQQRARNPTDAEDVQ
jgi:DNA polymerase-4